MNRLLLILAVCWAFSFNVNAHEVRPAYLELRETAPETYDILWKVPARGGNERLGIYVGLPSDTRQITEPHGNAAGSAWIERWRIQRAGGLAGQTLHIDGLEATGSDVLVRVEHSDGTAQTTRLLPSRPSFVVEAVASPWQVASTYVALGVEHILGGIDHLLFVFALLLLVKGWKRLIGTITAFTIAHSLTLAAAVLGFVHVPSPPVEAAIALSIVFVAAELVRGRHGLPGLTARRPWIIAFTFGLLHGFGFAGALSAVGLPQNSVPVALLFFNVGVELGQILFLAAVFAVVAFTRKIARSLAVPHPDWAWRVPPYAIGSVAMFWVIQRIAAF